MSTIIKLGEHYVDWSTICDAPLTRGMTREEIVQWYEDNETAHKAQQLPGRLARADATGTSSLNDTLKWLIASNRAGRDETRLTREQLVDWLVHRKGEGPPPVGTADDDDDAGEAV